MWLQCQVLCLVRLTRKILYEFHPFTKVCGYKYLYILLYSVLTLYEFEKSIINSNVCIEADSCMITPLIKIRLQIDPKSKKDILYHDECMETLWKMLTHTFPLDCFLSSLSRK